MQALEKNELSALMVAAKTNSIEAVRVFLENKADPDVADKEGRNALTYGILAGNVEIAKILFIQAWYVISATKFIFVFRLESNGH